MVAIRHLVIARIIIRLLALFKEDLELRSRLRCGRLGACTCAEDACEQTRALSTESRRTVALCARLACAWRLAVREHERSRTTAELHGCNALVFSESTTRREVLERLDAPTTHLAELKDGVGVVGAGRADLAMERVGAPRGRWSRRRQFSLEMAEDRHTNPEGTCKRVLGTLGRGHPRPDAHAVRREGKAPVERKVRKQAIALNRQSQLGERRLLNLRQVEHLGASRLHPVLEWRREQRFELLRREDPIEVQCRIRHPLVAVLL